jgi:hypothetical protein
MYYFVSKTPDKQIMATRDTHIVPGDNYIAVSPDNVATIVKNGKMSEQIQLSGSKEDTNMIYNLLRSSKTFRKRKYIRAKSKRKKAKKCRCN